MLRRKIKLFHNQHIPTNNSLLLLNKNLLILIVNRSNNNNKTISLKYSSNNCKIYKFKNKLQKVKGYKIPKSFYKCNSRNSQRRLKLKMNKNNNPSLKSTK